MKFFQLYVPGSHKTSKSCPGEKMEGNGFINEDRLRGEAEEMPLDLMGPSLPGADAIKSEKKVQRVIFEK